MVACGSGEPGGSAALYVIEVRGSKTALEHYRIAAEGLQVDADVIYEGDGYLRRLRGPWEITIPKPPPVLLQSWEGPDLIDSAEIRPFVCAGMDGIEVELRRGARVTETHHVVLTDEGTWGITTDPLYGYLLHKCEVSAPDGSSGDGVSTLLTTSAECTEPARAGTDLELTHSGPDFAEVSRPQSCWSLLTPHYGVSFLVGVTFSATLARGPLGIQLGHCLGPEPWTFPREVVVGTDLATDDCAAFSGVVESTVYGPVRTPASSGSWNIEALTFGVDARTSGDVDVEFAIEGSNEAYRLRGALSLPVVRDPNWSE